MILIINLSTKFSTPHFAELRKKDADILSKTC
jgi:hypothetical protein